MDRMSAKDKTVFIMSGLNSEYITEWSEVYTAVLNFVAAMYNERAECVSLLG